MTCKEFKANQDAQARASQVKQSLINQGISEPQLSMALAQAAHESNGFSSGLAKDDNNYSGITWNKKITSYSPSSSHRIPGGEQGTGTPYGHFDNTDQWAAAYKRNISKDRGHGSPMATDNISDYATRLGGIRDANGKAVANAYYTAPVGDYAKGLIRWKDCLGGVVANGNAAAVQQQATQNNNVVQQVNQNTDFKKTLEAIEANVDGLTADNVDVSWGSRQSKTEPSDWIGLRQFLMYLSTTYEPQSIVPFVELIPKFFMDESQSTNLWSKGVLGQQADNGTDLNLVSQKEALGFLKLKSKFNGLQQQGNNQGLDLLTLDPFQETGSFGKDNRNLGYRVFGAVVLNPGIKGQETSKAGAIGFKSLEISQGAQVEQGLTYVTIKILDVQGNKFLDVNSPWSFLLNASQVNGDFYFRYGWQIRVPEYNSKKEEDDHNSAGWKFWNHPGWKIFGEDGSSTGQLKSQISSLAKKGGGQLTLTQSGNQNSISNPGYQEKGSSNSDGTQSSVFTVNRDITNTSSMLKDYMIISMINPELSVNSEDGSVTATIQFLMNAAVANCMCTLSEAYNLQKLVSDAEDGIVTLGQLMKLYLKDNAEFIANREKLKDYKKYSIDDEKKLGEWVLVKNMKCEIIDPESIDKIKIPDDKKDINTVFKNNSSVKATAWLTEVLSANGLRLVSSGDPSTGTADNTSGFNLIWDQDGHSEISSKGAQGAGSSDNQGGIGGPANDAGNGFLGNGKIDRLTMQDDVFSFRFKGSLVEELSIENNENPNNGQTTNNQQAYAKGNLDNNKVEGGGVENNKTGAPNGAQKAQDGQENVSLKDKKTNLWYQLSKMSAATIKCMCHPWLKIANTVYIKGTGYFDGKYIVSKIKHTLNDSNKFETEINAVRVMEDKEYNNSQDQMNNNQTLAMNTGFPFFAQPAQPAWKGFPYAKPSETANSPHVFGGEQVKPKDNTDAGTRINNLMGGNSFQF